MALSASPEAPTSCVRVGLLVGRHPPDRGVPAHLPVVELLPELWALVSDPTDGAGRALSLVAAGNGLLDGDLSLHEQEVTDGALLVLQAEDAPVPLRAGHDLPGIVGEVVAHEHRTVDDCLRSRGHVVGAAVAAAVWTVLVVGIAPTSAPVAGGCSLIGAAVSVVVARRALVGVDAFAKVVAVGAALIHLVVAATIVVRAWLPGIDTLPGAGAVCGTAVAALLLLWASPGAREWAAAPALVVLAWAASVGIAWMTSGTASPVGTGTVFAAVAVVLVLCTGIGATWIVDLALVRPHSTSDDAPLPAPRVAERVRSATPLVLALDAGTLVVVLLAMPGLVSGGDAGLALWAAVATLLALRTRGEALAIRAGLGWFAASVLALGGGLTALASGAFGDGMSFAAAGVAGTWCILTLLVCLPGATGRVAATSQVRLLAVLERLLRVALPSLWLLHSGLLSEVLR